MYHHIKKLMYTVSIGTPDPLDSGNMLLEQFGGANGELAAAMQYSVQGLNCEDPERKDLLMDIGTEELERHLKRGRNAGSDASEAVEIGSQRGPRRSTDRHRRGWRSEPLQPLKGSVRGRPII